MTHLYFCRHGLSALNEAGLWSGSQDTPLTAAGRAQAEVAAEQAKKLDITYMLSSPLSRAYDTAVIIAAAIGYPTDKIEVNDLLIERHFGELEGKPWSKEINMDNVPGVEPMASLMARAQKIADYVKTIPSDNVLIVSHGSFGRALRQVLHPEIPFGGEQFGNAEVVQLL